MRTMDAVMKLFAGAGGILGATCFGMLGHWWASVPMGVAACWYVTEGVRILRAVERV